MAEILAADLIAKFQYALDNKWGYILNTWHTKWTQSLQDGKVSYMVKKYGNSWKDNSKAKNDDSYTAAMYGSRWIGQWVTDCSGLFYWAFKELGGYMYHGSNTMWDKYCISKGKLSKGKRTDGQTLKPGTAVFVLKGTSNRSHVGLYIGNDIVIEASGTQSGVITTKITNTKWCEWGELKGVIFNSNSTPASNSTPTPTPTPSNTKSALVIGTRLALRSAPSTDASILTRVDKGERVQLLDDTEWVKVKYQGKTGYMMAKYLQF